MKFLCLVVFIFFQKSPIALGQVTLQNIGFETGTFAGWNGYTGQCCPVYTPNNGITSTQHLITSGANTDPYSNGLLSTTAPGSQFSVRLGNDNNSAESEVLETTFIVPNDSLLMVIKYATVLQNGLHPDNKQSRFSYEVFSQNHILEGCTTLEVLAGQTDASTVYNGDIEITQWQNRVINLFGMTGDTLTLRFTTGDCGPGGHFGYAYIDCEVLPANLYVNACNSNGSMDLSVNSLVDVQWFDGDTASNITIANPVINGSYYVEFNSRTDCYFRLPIHVDQILPKAEFSYAYECNHQIQFTNSSYSAAGSIYNWDFGDNSTSSVTIPIHQYTGTGNYQVILSVIQPNNCRSVYTETIPVDFFPETDILIGDSCLYEPVELSCNYNSSGQTANSYSWYINNEFISHAVNPDYVFTEAGIYNIMVTIENVSGCTDTSNAIMEFHLNPACLNGSTVYIPNAFTPNYDGKNDFLTIRGIENNSLLPFEIYNRYGELIFKGDKWNGTSKNIGCQQGQYILKCVYKIENKEVIATKSITLLR